MKSGGKHKACRLVCRALVARSVLRGRGRFGPLGLHAPFSVLRGGIAAPCAQALAALCVFVERGRRSLQCGVDFGDEGFDGDALLGHGVAVAEGDGAVFL